MRSKGSSALQTGAPYRNRNMQKLLTKLNCNYIYIYITKSVSGVILRHTVLFCRYSKQQRVGVFYIHACDGLQLFHSHSGIHPKKHQFSLVSCQRRNYYSCKAATLISTCVLVTVLCDSRESNSPFVPCRNALCQQ